MHTVSLRMLLYPLTVIKTRLQVLYNHNNHCPVVTHVLTLTSSPFYSSKSRARRRTTGRCTHFAPSSAMRASPDCTKVGVHQLYN